MATREQLVDEAARLRKVRQLVDLATSLIMQASLSREEAEHLVADVRLRILQMFPGSEETYNIVYARRFRRLIEEFTSGSPVPGSVVLPYPTVH